MPHKDRQVRLKYLRDYRKKNRKRLLDFDKRRRASDTERRAKHKKHRQKYPEKVRAASRKWRYGISPEDYALILKKQKNRCALCGRKETQINYKTKKVQSLCVDHNHSTKKIRALLCCSCNQAIGLFDESVRLLRKAIKYLKRF